MKHRLFSVIIIGTGPGDPELITLKGIKAIEQAEVIVYDSSQVDQILPLCPENADVVKLNKRKDISEEQVRNEVIDVIQRYFKQGKRVVRLKVGDALMFGRGATEAAIMKDREIPFEIIPGITSANSAAASYGIRLTEKDQSDALIYFMAAEFPKNRQLVDKMSVLLKQGATLAIYMAEKNILEIVQTLMLNNIPGYWSIIAVSKADMSGQKVLRSTLAEIYNITNEVLFESPTTFFIGKFVDVTNIVE